MSIPIILQDISNYLSQYSIAISEKVEGEGRGGSLKDEGAVKKALMEHETFQHHMIDEAARKFGDMVILDYDKTTRYVVNIKTSIGSTDNCFSKAGMVYAFTDLHDNDIPKAMNFKTMHNLIETHKADIPGRDYWFLCIDKNDSSKVLVRGAKQIQHWVVNINPSNILQVNWKKEKICHPLQRSWDEAYNVIMGGVKQSLQGFVDSLPSDWIQVPPVMFDIPLDDPPAVPLTQDLGNAQLEI